MGLLRAAISSLLLLALLILSLARERETPGVRTLRVDNPRGEWTAASYLELVPTIRLPTTATGRDDVRVWLKLAPGSRIHASPQGDPPRPLLALPAGSTAARVESYDGVIADVRGTLFGAPGAERFFVLRPAEGGLRGFEWARGDPSQQADVTLRLGELVRRTMSPAHAAAAAAHVVRQNDCAGCHVYARAANATRHAHGLVNRPTDARGVFQLTRVFEDDAPLESYKPHDPNVGAPFVDVRCGDAPAIFDGDGASRRARCEGNLIPVAHFDVARAAAAADPHALRVCASRRALVPWLDTSVRTAFAHAFTACGISPT